MESFTLDEFTKQKYMAGYLPQGGGYVPSSDADDMLETLIESRCGEKGAYCKSAQTIRQGGLPYSIEYLADNLPAVQYVAQFYLELIIHGGILAKDDSNQEKLDKWIRSTNPLGQTNGNVLRQALLSSIIYGYSGLRKIGNDLVYVAPSQFQILKLPAFMYDKAGRARAIPGILRPFLYEVYSSKEVAVEKKKAREFPQQTPDEVKEALGLKKGVDGSFYQGDSAASATSVYVPFNHFCHLRHFDEGDYGVSPLSKDRLRTTLIIDYIRNVIDEVSNDGNDYMIYLRQRSNVGSSLAGMISATAANATINAAVDAKEKKNANETAMASARALANKMKRSQKTRLNIINKNVIEEVEKLDGTVQLNNYLTILNDAKGTVADIYGIAAMLAGSSGGGWSTGMSALIPFTIERTIKPFQQRYAEQLSPMIRECADIKGSVHFKELDWEDEKTQAEIEKLRAETEKALAEANKNKVDEAKIKKETKLLNSQGVNGANKTTTSSSSSTTKKSTPKK